MRRKERAIQNKEALETIIKENDVLRLGLAVENVPYIVPLNYGYYENTFYIHCAKEGRKLDMIRENPYVCFEIDSNHQLVKGDEACKYTMKFKSIIGYGHAEILDTDQVVKDSLDVIMKQFSDDHFKYDEGVLKRVAIIKLSVEEMIGKSN